MGVLFCNDDGTVRYKDIDGLDARADGAASHGGFLQIEMVRLVEAHRHKDVGVRCIKALLEWMNAREGGRESTLRWGAEYNTLHSSWTLAALEPGLETTKEDWGRARTSAQEEQPSAEEEAHEEERKAQAIIANRKVALQWARLGFCQAKFAGPASRRRPRWLSSRSQRRRRSRQQPRLTSHSANTSSAAPRRAARPHSSRMFAGSWLRAPTLTACTLCTAR